MKRVHLIVLPALFITSCHSSKKAFLESQSHSESVQWPTEYAPSEADFFVHNYIDIEASPETVWSIVIDAMSWSEYYDGASEVQLDSTNSGMLELGTVIHWVTMGFDFKSTVVQYEPYKRLAWESYRSNMNGYHAWLIIPTTTGCRLITDESQNGSLARVERIFQPYKLERLHGEWLEGIKIRAEAAKD
ncbi:MAG: SRPBCC family protein [Flavobacteriia bacterium]|nr:SRPBCC family protein [Flavobacteriia bacterium]